VFFPHGSDFGWSVDNWGATLTDTGIGTNIPGNASANVKGANTQVLTGIAEDCYGIHLMFSGTGATTVAQRHLVDLIIDPAAGVGGAGSAWSVIIANLLFNASRLGTSGAFGTHFYFPLYLKKGTAIGLVHQSSTTTTALRGCVRVYGKPKRIDAIRCGTKVQSLGPVTGSTSGAAITPGTSAWGSYTASLGAISGDKWWWQGGIADNDTSRTARGQLVEIAANVTNKIKCGDFNYGVVGTIEESFKTAFATHPNYKEIASGQGIYMRAAGLGGAGDSTTYCAAYALGG
jgi:hypothetical protein